MQLGLWNLSKSSYSVKSLLQEAELKKDAERLNRWKIDHINQLLDLLDLPRGKDEAGTKVVC